MPPPPPVVVFDVNQSLSDMRPMAERFTAVGAPASVAPLWFAALLRDGFALAAAGGSERFAVLAEQGLRRALAGIPLEGGIDDAVDHVLAGFSELPVHQDVPEGIRALRHAGRRLVTLSNGSAQVAEDLLTRATLAEEFEQFLSVEDAGAWKPDRRSYAYAARICQVSPSDMVLVAVHEWDIHGAAEAGLATAWINRDGDPYPSYFHRPTWEVTDLRMLAGAMGG